VKVDVKSAVVGADEEVAEVAADVDVGADRARIDQLHQTPKRPSLDKNETNTSYLFMLHTYSS